MAHIVGCAYRGVKVQDSAASNRRLVQPDLRLQHVAITAPRDAAAQVRAFYGNVLGLEERNVLPSLDSSQFVWFRVGDCLELHVMLVDELPRHRPHFCLIVDGDLDDIRRRIQSAGIDTADAPPIVGRPRFTCRDPFGNLVELCELVSDGTDRLTD